ncbi:MAG: prephenate dehydrogenase/arogenate dehydrogenase family protein [Methyloversatilis discipulorum]|uniref:prephenate dehydrogenase n=1 Tax=Methyloversatilis discipulorum TaxID=1119528 RepID=UPI0026ECE384|nr:prephenate dehydrogenase/arogenate dehydrogenase family protein [Methyloversatilis discipulorum]MBT9519130.1 prephenate dehydrogenase/arogenate dehydrogenase family protein [Methyloversatilis discipulorum]
MSAPLIGRLVVVGVGLIGGSFAAALRRAGQVGEIVGVGRSADSKREALELGLIDRAESDWAAALAGADLVLLAMPVGQMDAVMSAMLPHLPAHTVVTDAGSTKGDVVASARRCFGERVGQFVPGHPIAGAEKSGPQAARADLYDRRRVVLTPLAENGGAAIELVRQAWLACGALLTVTTPEHHDRWLASVSHLPHLLSFALVSELAARPNAEEIFNLAGGGFRDFTRIAGSHPEMWRDIFFANREALLTELSAYETELARYRALIESGDAVGLEALIGTAREARTAWAQRQG